MEALDKKFDRPGGNINSTRMKKDFDLFHFFLLMIFISFQNDLFGFF
jgi:hypothetical protein